MRRTAILILFSLLTLAMPPDGKQSWAGMHCALYRCPPLVPFRLISSKPFVQVRVNGSGPFWFILDTGSSGGSILDRKRALELGLKIEGEKKGHQGAGEGAVITVGHARGVDIDVSGNALPNQGVAVVPLDHVAVFEGHQFDGTLGRTFFNRYVVEIDYAKKMLQLHDPKTYRYAGPGRIIPFEFLNGLVLVRATVTPPGRKPIEANFVVDTGSRVSVTFNRPFTVKHKLLKAMPKAFEATIGGGVGGESKGRIGRLESMKLGPFLLKEPVAVMSNDKTGVLASDAFAGIIGGPILERCKVIFDYRRKQMILEPNAKTPKHHDYDKSGLFLVAEGPDFKKFKVLSVVKNSPADRAGIRKGDVITKVNGRGASSFILEEVRHLLRRDGQEIKLEIRRGSETRQVDFKTKRLI